MTAALKTVCLLLLLLVAAPTTAQSLLSEEAFTEAFARELRAQEPALPLRQEGPLRIVGTTTAGKHVRTYLDNAYHAYRQDATALDAMLQRYAASLLETWRDDEAIDQSRIVPVIKDVAYLPDIRAQMRAAYPDSDWEPAYEPYNDALVILYAEDSELQTRYMSAEVLDKSGFPVENRRQRALENLKALLPKVQVFADEGFYWVTAGGDYDASLLLFDGLWQRLDLPIEGELVAAVPARNAVLITGIEDAAGLAALKRAVADVIATDSYALTDTLFVFRDGKFDVLAE